MPSAYDLLPSQQYYNNAGSFVKTVNTTDGINFTEKDLNYAESGSFLTGTHSLNSTALANAVNLHTQNFDNFDLRTAGVDLYAIDSCNAGTMGQITEISYIDLLGKNQITYATPTEIPGDNTVPLDSSTNLPINSANKYYALVSDHGKMPSEDGIRQEIVNLISGSV